MIGDNLFTDFKRRAEAACAVPPHLARLTDRIHSDPLSRQMDEARREIGKLEEARAAFSPVQVSERYRRRAEEIAEVLRGRVLTFAATLRFEGADDNERGEGNDNEFTGTDAVN